VYDEGIVVPKTWLDLDFGALRGVLLVIGAPNTGKSTFAHWLFDRLAGFDWLTAFLDGDVGQSMLSPPTTMTLALPAQRMSQAGTNDFRNLAHWFVGDVSPRGHMLPLVVGAGRLVRRSQEAGAETVIVDTTGLVDEAQGGVALKHALVDQLQPTTVVAFRRQGELEPILAPLRQLPCPQVIEMPVINVVRHRGVPTRQAYRAKAFRRYFAGTRVLRLSLQKCPVFGGQAFARGRLLALRDARGYTLALGVILKSGRDSDELFVRTPLTNADAVASVQLGAIGLDIATGREFRPGRKR
jgi:polynucleotide 5'-hydroxyl-kinase GRC3/NOL9